MMLKEKRVPKEKLVPNKEENIELTLLLTGEDELDVKIAKILEKVKDPCEFVYFALQRVAEMAEAGVKEEDFDAMINASLARRAKNRLRRKEILDDAHKA